jgi:hypothetical protein
MNLAAVSGRITADGSTIRVDYLKIQEKVARIIVMAPYFSRSEKDSVGLPEKVIRCRNWAEALEQLKGKNGKDQGH